MKIELSNLNTVGNYQVRNVKVELGSDCKCSLNKSYLIGEILIGEQWHPTKWNLDGTNLSGVSRWHLINISNATDIEARDI